MLAAAGAGVLLWAGACAAQDEESAGGGEFLENQILGRPVAVRVRAEAQFTEDDEDLLSDDAGYARFPTRMYSTETKVFQSDRSAYTATYQIWRNGQGQDLSQWSVKSWVPLARTDAGDDYHLTLRYRDRAGDEDAAGRQNWVAGVDRSSPNGLYAYLQFREAVEEGQSAGHEVYEYVSWKPTGMLRLGEQAGIADADGSGAWKQWYAGAFGTAFLKREATALRLEARYYASGADLDYRRYNLCLYQKVGARSLVRLSCRLYDDNGGLSSQAYGLKFQHYFTARLMGHVAYRYYDHSAGADFDTFYGGVEILL